MKKIFVMILIGALSVGLLGCQKQPENPASHLEETEPEEASQVGDADNTVETVLTESDEVKTDAIDFISGKESNEVQKLQQKMEEFCQAYFNGDSAEVKKYLSAPFSGNAEVYADLSKEKIADIREVTGLSDVNELIESEEYVLSMPFVVPGEDSMTYLTVSFISEDGEWVVSSYGIEK